MKTTEKTSLLEFLQKAKEIMVSKGETRFDELGKSSRIAICELFEKYFDYESDGDCDSSFEFVDYDDEFRILIESQCEYTSDFDECSSDLCIYDLEGEQHHDINDMIDVVSAIEPEDETIALLNTSIATVDGVYELETITLDQALEIIDGANLDSAIGHDATAQIMTELLGVNVPVSRQMFSQQAGQRAIVFKLHGRLQEGKILDRQDVEAMGYDLKLLTRLS